MPFAFQCNFSIIDKKKKPTSILFLSIFPWHTFFNGWTIFSFTIFPWNFLGCLVHWFIFHRIVSMKNHIHLARTTLFQWCSQSCMEMHVSNANMYFDHCMELHFQLYLVNPTIFSGWLSFVKGVTRLCNWTTSCTTKNILVIIYSPWENPIVDETLFHLSLIRKHILTHKNLFHATNTKLICYEFSILVVLTTKDLHVILIVLCRASKIINMLPKLSNLLKKTIKLS
jgi:hypothetical protein